jgi:hypothetical protein
MTPLDQIKALAELDGWKFIPAHTIKIGTEHVYRDDWWTHERTGRDAREQPDYLKSRDAITNLIDAQPTPVRKMVVRELVLRVLILRPHARYHLTWITATELDFLAVLAASPAHLSESLLRAIGKWEESE